MRVRRERVNPALFGVFAVFFLAGSCVGVSQAGLPPTSTKALGDSAKKTTFNFEFPTQTVSRSGVTSTFYPPDQGPVNLLGLSSAYTPTQVTDRNAEISVGNWAAYADAAATSPADMTGGSPNTTIARSTSSPINGTGHFLLTLTTGATRQGEGAAVPVYIPPAYRGGMLEFAFPFTTTGTITEDDLKLYAYDVTNATVITPYYAGKILGAGPGRASAIFPISTTTAQLRVGIHVARASNTGAVTVLFDDVLVSPQIATYGMAGSDVQSYSPTLGAGFGTTSGSTFFYWRVGDNLHVHGYWINGTVAGSPATISLPSGLAIDTTKTDPDNTSANPGAMVGHYTTSTGQHGAIVTATGTSTTLVYLGHQDSNVGALTPQNGNTITSNSVSMTVDFVVPISGWSSNVTMANSSQFKISSYLASGSRVTGSAPTALGQYRSYLRNSSANTFTETNGSPTATPSVADGMRIYNDSAWGSASTNNEPVRYEIFVGRNKSIQWLWYQSAGRTGFVSTVVERITTTTPFGYYTHYDPTTGIATVTTVQNSDGTAGHVSGRDSANASTNDPYFDIVVSENALAVGMDSTQVISNSKNERMERAYITVSASTPAITRQSGSWVASLTDNGTGDTTLNLTSGMFSSAPTCTCSILEGASNELCHLVADPTTAAIRIITRDGDTGAARDNQNFYIICMGPR